MRLIGRNNTGVRYQLWPIRLGCHREKWARTWGWHGWCTGYDRVPEQKTSRGWMPGYRAVFGQTVHLWALFISFGRVLAAPGGVCESCGEQDPTTRHREMTGGPDGDLCDGCMDDYRRTGDDRPIGPGH